MKQKKAQDLSLTTIIVAALAILVLVVLAVIFTGRIGKFTKEAESCGAKGGRCVDASECDLAGNEVIRDQYSCSNTELKCCLSKAVVS